MGQGAFSFGGGGGDFASGGRSECADAACGSACHCGSGLLGSSASFRRKDALKRLDSRRRITMVHGKHKAKLDRLLQSARSDLGTILETEAMSRSARIRLQAIDQKLCDAEVEHKVQHEAMLGLKMTQQWRQLLSEGENGGSLGHENQATRNFLLQNYSTHDSNAVSNSHLTMTWQRPPRLSQASSARMQTESGEEDEGNNYHSKRHWMVRTSMLLKMSDVRRMLDAAGSLDFDSISFAELPEVLAKPLEVLGMELLVENGTVLEDLSRNGWIEDGDTFRTRLFHFLEAIGGLYKEVRYHSVAHAADVTSTAEWFMRMPFMRARATPLDHLMCLVAAAIHDVGHPGTNPLFHVATMSELAIRYNDKSVLENMHISLAFETMLKPGDGCNWFALLPKDFTQGGAPHANIQRYMRRGLVAMVLATDMSGHTKHVQRLREIGVDEEEWQTVATEGQEEEFLERNLFLLETVLHAADLNSPCKPRQIMLGWTQRVLEEFWAQGDEEIRLGLPMSPLCDRKAGQATVPKDQLLFLQFVIEPFYTQIAMLMRETTAATSAMAQNKKYWEDMDKQKATYDEIFLSPRAATAPGRIS